MDLVHAQHPWRRAGRPCQKDTREKRERLPARVGTRDGAGETTEHRGIIKLYDMEGQEVGSQTITTGRAQVDVSKLAQGMYQWSIRMNGANLGQGKVTIF